MALCKFCNKWMEKGTGKRKKEFCNETCRSNYWYAKNKKRKQPLTTVQVVKEVAKRMGKEVMFVNSDDKEEPLSFEKLQQKITPNPQSLPKTIPQYMNWKREIQDEGEYQVFCQDVEANYTLNRKQKDFCKTANPSQL